LIPCEVPNSPTGKLKLGKNELLALDVLKELEGNNGATVTVDAWSAETHKGMSKQLFWKTKKALLAVNRIAIENDKVSVIDDSEIR
jgi:hypothetical protein